MKLSIIIPAYNVEKYIERCLDSIYNQNLSNDDFEIIAINDGSTDNTGHILEKFAKIHDNIIVINQENKGVSGARNAGIEITHGEFMTFVDADDIIIENSLSELYKYISQNNDFELLILEREVVKVGHKKIKAYNSQDIKSDRFYSGKELFTQYKYFRGSSCGVIYLTNFIKQNGIKFPLNIKNSEDTTFASQCMVYAEKIKFYDIEFYKYINRPDSASNIIDRNTLKSYLQAVEFSIDFANERKLQDIDKSIFEYLKWGFLSTFIVHAIQLGVPYREFKTEYNISSYIPLSSKHFPTGKIGVFLLNHSFWLFYNLLKFRIH